MAHIAFISPPLHSHMSAMLALADAARARGHAATFVAVEDMRSTVEQHGFGFAGVGADTHPIGAASGIADDMGRVRGVLGMGRVHRGMAAMTDMLCREAPVAVEAFGADAIVCDQHEPAGGLIADHLGLPHVSVACAIPINREPGTPPFFSHWLPDPSNYAWRRSLSANAFADLIERPHNRIVAAWARRWRLGPRRSARDCLSRTAEISQTVASFDFPRKRAPALIHCGPLRMRAVRDHPSVPLDFADGRPLVFASFGTLFGGRLGLFRAVAEACAKLDLALLVAHCGRLTEAQCRTLPGQVRAVAFAPHVEVLSKAAICVTHAGLNTALDAIAAGVPALAIPMAYDQPGVAARLVWAGAGERIVPHRATPQRIAALLSRLLTAPSYRIAARRIGDQIRRAGGAAQAAGIVERVAGARLPERSASS